MWKLFQTHFDGPHVRLRLHFVKPAYDAVQELAADERLHFWDRDDMTVDVVGERSHEVADRLLEAAQAVVPGERARIDAALQSGAISPKVHEALSKRLDALAAETAPELLSG
jgi:hypothetical protein